MAPLKLAGLPQMQDLKGEAVTEKNEPVPGVTCTLTGGVLLPENGLSVTTGEHGEFTFPGLAPGTYNLVCAGLGYQPVVKQGLEVTASGAPFVQVVMVFEQVLKQQVEVKGQVSGLAQQATAPPATVTAPQLTTLPLVEQKFKAALPLLPGVIRTPDGRINIKGIGEMQGLLLVDSAEMVDPVTGSFAIEIPLDAVQSLDVFKSAYRAEYGRFSGGLTSVETKPPSDQFHFEINDFLPTPRIKGGHIIGIADDEPRVYLTGPLVDGKLSFSEAAEYELNKQPVRGLAYPHNEIKTQGVNSFTSLQYVLSSQHLMTMNLDVFPRRQQFANINSLVPQSASSDYGQRGFSSGLTDRYMLSSGGVLTTLFQYTRFDSYGHGQGPEDMLVTPNGWQGNFFNRFTRASDQEELRQNYLFPRFDLKGKHELKVGWELVRRGYTGTSQSHTVLLTRPDGTTAERIDFVGPGKLSVKDTELAVFAQDHWAFTEHLAADAGVRYSGQTLGEPTSFAPRVGLVYSPDAEGKTILRGGFGVFYDRVPLLAGDWVQNPARQVTLFDARGIPLGPPLLFQNAYIKTQENGQQIVPSQNRLDSTPHNLTWNLEADRELRPGVLVRLSYLSSRTYEQFVVNPVLLSTGPTLLLSNTGNSRYHEFESTLRLRPRENADINFSYVRSLARGDLNTLGALFVPFQAPVIRPNAFGNLPSNVPNRFVTWGKFRLLWDATVTPVLDVHSGFPYSAVDVLQNYVGVPNSFRFPAFTSLDLKFTKDFRIPFLPLLRSHKFRGAFSVFNLTNHLNPRDVYNNMASPFFGSFVGLQHRSFDVYLDVAY